VTSLADLCTALESGAISGHQLGKALAHARVGEGGGVPLEKCLQGLGIVVDG
jgi:hypothetical protein